MLLRAENPGPSQPTTWKLFMDWDLGFRGMTTPLSSDTPRLVCTLQSSCLHTQHPAPSPLSETQLWNKMPMGISPCGPRPAVKMGVGDTGRTLRRAGIGTRDSLATWRSAKPRGLQPYPHLPAAKTQVLVSYLSAILVPTIWAP